MGVFKRIRQAAAQIQELSEQAGADAASARAEWGDGGTARRGWDSEMHGLVAPAPDAVPEAEIERLTTLTDGLRAVLASGEAGTAVIRGVRDTGERIARHALLDVDLALRPAHGPERTLTVRVPTPGTTTGGYDDGAEHPVRVDPADPRRLAFVWEGTPRSDRHRAHVRTTSRPDPVGLLPGRALLEGFESLRSRGELGNRITINLSAQLRRPGGELGDAVFCPHYLDWRSTKLVQRGTDVPVSVDPRTGELEDVLAEALDDELRPRFDEFSGLDEFFVEPIREVGDQVRAGASTARDIASGDFFRIENPTEDGFAPGDPIMAPANGVTFEQWVAVSAEIAHSGTPPDQREAVAARHGVPDGAWAEASRQWGRRQMGHPLMAEKYGRALERRIEELGPR